MKKLAVVMALLVGINGRAFSDTPATATVDIGGQSMAVQLLPAGDGTWEIAVPGTDFSSGSTSITINSLTLDTDPGIYNFFGGVNNGSSPATFGTSQSINVSLPAGQYILSTSIGGSVTNGGSNGVTLSPLSTSQPILQAFANGVDQTGVDLISQPLTFSTPPYSTQTFGSYSASEQLTLNAVTSIAVSTNFALTGSDSASFTYSFTVTPVVPEPSSWALLLAGMITLVMFARRKSPGD